MRPGLLGLWMKQIQKEQPTEASSVKMGPLDYMTGLAIGFCLFVVLVLTLVQSFSQSPTYYMNKFEKLEISRETTFESFGITAEHPLSQKQLTLLAEGMTSFLSHNQSDFIAMIPVEVKGQSKIIDGYNQREKDHMKDVRFLFDKFDGFKRMTAGIGILLLALTMFRYGKWYGKRYANLFVLCMKTMTLFTVGFTLLLVVLQFVDFNRYFIMFHQLFFTNDLWQLDPANSLLINLLPESFFVGFVMDVVLGASAVCAILLSVSVVVRKKVR